MGDKPSQEVWNQKGSTGAVGAHGYAGQFTARQKAAYADGKIPVPSGRWPPNVVLVHAPGCTNVGTRVVQNLSGGVHLSPGSVRNSYRKIALRTEWQAYGEGGKETVAAWKCDPRCPVRLLDEQSGERRSAGNYPTTFSNGGGFTKGDIGKNAQGPLYDDAGGASRFYPQFRDEGELLEWIERLVGVGGAPGQERRV